MSTLVGQPGELTMTLQIIRKDTGEVIDCQAKGYVTFEQAEAIGLIPDQDATTEKEAE
jgi:hypothetical protein